MDWGTAEGNSRPPPVLLSLASPPSRSGDMSRSPHSCPQLASARPATSARHARTGGVFRDACVPLLRPRFLCPGTRTLGRSAPPCLTVRDDRLAVQDSVDAWDGLRPDRGAAKEKADSF